MEELVTCDLILNWLKERVQKKDPIAPGVWLDAVMKLNTLASDETDKLIELESLVANLKATELEDGKSVAAARAVVEASTAFMALRKQQEKIKQIIEAIRLGKLAARIKNDELTRQ